MPDISNAILTPIAAQDVDHVIALYRTYMRTNQTPERIAFLVHDYPSCKAVLEGRLVGFSYTSRFAPDVLEICNIYVDGSVQNAGLGTRILTHIHQQAAMGGYRAAILGNSRRYDTLLPKQDPRNFYLRFGYRIILETEETTIYAKELG